MKIAFRVLSMYVKFILLALGLPLSLTKTL